MTAVKVHLDLEPGGTNRVVVEIPRAEDGLKVAPFRTGDDEEAEGAISDLTNTGVGGVQYESVFGAGPISRGRLITDFQGPTLTACA